MTRTVRCFGAMIACLATVSTCCHRAMAQPAGTDPDSAPILRLEAGGPTSFVSALAFNPQGSTLYAGSWDKVVRTWTWDASARRFILDPVATYRVPVGPALEGVINAIAVSPDGMWLAAAGQGVVRGASDLKHPGWKVPAEGVMNAAMREDEGTISLFNTRTREVRSLRGHTGPVFTLTFAPAYAGKPLVVVSAGRERSEGKAPFAGAVRAWDAASAEYLGGVMLPDVGDMRPGIAAWHTGASPKQVRVAVAWGDNVESLRIWDLETGAMRTVPDGQFNNTIAWWPEAARVITGSTSRLKLWNVPQGPAANPVVERELPLGSRVVPRAIALFSSTERGRLDRAAVVVRRDGDATMRLRVVDLTNFRLLDQQVPLWDGSGIGQSIAATPGGRHVAVTGNRNHEIATFATSDLLTRQAAPGVLRGSGIAARQVSFVKKDGALGVLVSQRAKAAPGSTLVNGAEGDLVFNPVERRVSSQLAGWQIVRPAQEGWSVDVSSAAGNGRPGATVLTVRDGQRTRQIPLPEDQRLTDFSLLPPVDLRAVPILAVATHRLGQPLLELYDVTTGAVVRELSGHVAAIESLAFSDDGRLLASSAGDRTVCVWNLTDLDQVVGVRGTLTGVVFEPKDKSLIVARIAPDSPYDTAQLAVGDTLVGWDREGQVEPFGSLVDFYLQLSRLKPGETVTLARQRGDRAAETVQLVLGQGTDERKPLFTLFITRGEPSNWIGWSPLGPYESSGEAVEQLLGWHFNTGQPKNPARFATAGEYRHLRREGLLEHLMSQATLPDQSARALDRPSMSIRLKQPGQETVSADQQGPLRLVGQEAELELEIRSLAADQVDTVTWRVGQTQPKPLEPISRQVWSARLSDLPLERRAWQVNLSLTTAEAQPQTFTEDVSLVYQPPAPVFEQVRPAAELSTTKDQLLAISAEVRSLESATAGLNVSLTHTAGQREVLARQFSGEGQLKVDESIDLQPGDNTITLTATNASAPPGEEAPERTVLVRRITYNPAAVPAAQLLVEAVLPDRGERRMLTSDRSQPFVVDSPTLSLEGRIGAQKPLEQAEWSLDDKRTPFSGFAKSTVARLNVRESIALTPGPQRIGCVARAERGLPTEVSLTVDYRPRLGETFLTAPRADSEFFEGRDPRRITVSGRIGPAEDKRPCQAVVLLNGQAAGEPLAIDEGAETFSTEVELGNGDNRIQVQLSNAWGARSTSEAVRVRYLRPPQIVDLSVPKVVDAPLVDVSLTAESPSDLQLTGVKINDAELPAGAAVIERNADNPSRWTIVARDVALAEGVNEIRPLVRNDDGWSMVTKTARVEVMLPPPPKAQIELVSPQVDRTVESSRLDLQFAIRSPSRLKRVEVRNGTQSVSAVDVSAQIENPDAGRGDKLSAFHLETTVRVDLQPRDNQLRIVAVNDGGESQESLTVTYVRKPVEVVIDRVQSQLKGESSLVAEVQEGGRVRFPGTMAESSLWLHGRVRWPDAATQQLNQVSVVQVWVNGFLQQPVPLKPPRATSLEWAWKAKIRLNRGGENDVSVRLPDVARTADCRLDFKIDCSKPDERQRLHLLVVGVGEKDARQLETLALRAVRGRRTTGDQISTPAFAKGWIYLLSGYVNRGRVTAQLERIHLRVGDPADAGADVVMIYYRGQESIDDRGQFYLLTSQSQYDPDMRSSAVSGKDLSERFSSVPGAQLFLLDVQRRMQAGTGPAISTSAAAWPSEPQMAALRYAWLSNDTAPADARLLVAFDNALPRATRLGEIESEVSRDSRRARQQYGQKFQYEPRVPEALRYLVLAKSVAAAD